MEAWKFAGKDLWKRFVDMLKQIWKESKIPDDWKKSLIVPLYKRGIKNKWEIIEVFHYSVRPTKFIPK